MALLNQSGGVSDETTHQRLTQHGQIMGTGAYMSPKQAVDVRNVDGRSDCTCLC